MIYRTVLFLLSALILPLSLFAALPAWRGVLIDSSRHFVSPAELRELFPLLQEAGINVLQLHLTDGPGWRLESKAFPELTQKGAWRVDKTDRPWAWRETEFWTPEHAAAGKKRYGGFYTQADLRSLALTAASYGIRIVPELDVPGHSAALLVARPDLACPTNRDPAAWFRGKDVICIGNPATLPFLETLLDELCAIFPDSPLHIGCDEVPELAWDACPLCNDPAVRKRFYTQLIAAVKARGREVIAWDELRLTGADISEVRLSCWHDEVTPRPQDIACPYSFCYLDQAASRARLADWEIPDGVFGIQLNLWTEEMPTAAIRKQHLVEGLTALRTALERKEKSAP